MKIKRAIIKHFKKILVILFVLITTLGYSQTTDCCDSLMKFIKGKTTKTICRKSTNGQSHDIIISVDNSHSANNYASGQSGQVDTFSQPNPCQASITYPRPSTNTGAPKGEGFNWWDDFFKLIIQLLTALAPVFILIWKYVAQKQKEFAERILESKRNAYSEFLSDFTETSINIAYDKEVGGIEDDRRRINARNLLLLYGNDAVVEAYNNWVNYSDSEGSKIDREVALFGKILIEIRKDLHGDSRLTEKDITNLNPFERG